MVSLVRRCQRQIVVLLLALSCPCPLSAAPLRLTDLADGFDFPVGKPHAKGYYKYRGFIPNHHMGEDWNGLGGGDSDLGKPIYSIAHGLVVYSHDYRSNWGNVIIIRHAYRHNGRLRYVDSLYGHLRERLVQKFDHVRKGQKIGTMGNNRGMYKAHLHFEIRRNINIGLIHRRYARDYSNYYSPSSFIRKHRSLALELDPQSVPVDSFHSGILSSFRGPSLASVPDNPLLQPKTAPTLDPLVREILERHELMLPDATKLPSDKDQEEAADRAKIRAFWSTNRHRIQTMMSEEDTLGHD